MHICLDIDINLTVTDAKVIKILRLDAQNLRYVAKLQCELCCHFGHIHSDAK